MKQIAVGLLLGLSMNVAQANVFEKSASFNGAAPFVDSASLANSGTFADSASFEKSVPTTKEDTTFTPDYRWPIDISRHLSGTFGETRSAHFHSGLDIKTWGREGYPVFASERGYISCCTMFLRSFASCALTDSIG